MEYIAAFVLLYALFIFARITRRAIDRVNLIYIPRRKGPMATPNRRREDLPELLKRQAL